MAQNWAASPKKVPDESLSHCHTIRTMGMRGRTHLCFCNQSTYADNHVDTVDLLLRGYFTEPLTPQNGLEARSRTKELKKHPLKDLCVCRLSTDKHGRELAYSNHRSCTFVK